MTMTMNSKCNTRWSPVRAAREAANLSREQLAVKAGCGTSTVYLAERGLISAATAAKLAAVLGCDPAELLAAPEREQRHDDRRSSPSKTLGE